MRVLLNQPERSILLYIPYNFQLYYRMQGRMEPSKAEIEFM